MGLLWICLFSLRLDHAIQESHCLTDEFHTQKTNVVLITLHAIHAMSVFHIKFTMEFTS